MNLINKWQFALLTLLTILTLAFIAPQIVVTIPKSFPNALTISQEVQDSLKLEVISQTSTESNQGIVVNAGVNLKTVLAEGVSIDDLLKAKLAAINLTDVAATAVAKTADATTNEPPAYAYDLTITFPYIAYKYDYLAITDYLINSTSLDKVVNRQVALALDLSLIGINSKLFNFLPGQDFYSTWTVPYTATGATSTFNQDVNTIASRVKAAGLNDVVVQKSSSETSNTITLSFPNYYTQAQAESLTNIFTRPGVLQIWEHSDTAEPNELFNSVLADYKPVPSDITVQAISDGTVEFNSNSGTYTWRVNFNNISNEQLQQQIVNSGYQLPNTNVAPVNPFKPLIITMDEFPLIVFVNPSGKQFIGTPSQFLAGDELTMKALLSYLTNTAGINTTFEGREASSLSSPLTLNNLLLLVIGLPAFIVVLALVLNRKFSSKYKLYIILATILWLVATVGATKLVSSIVNLNYVLALYLVAALSVSLLSYYSKLITLRQTILWIAVFLIITVFFVPVGYVAGLINIFILWSLMGMVLCSWAFKALPFYYNKYE